MSTNVEAECKGDLVKAWIDGEELDFGTNQRATIRVADGQHALTWVVVGAPGEQYEIKLNKPESIAFAHAASLDHDRRDAGLHWFATGATP